MKIAPHGSWTSPIDAGVLTGDVMLHDPLIEGDHLYWAEGRPAEKGRVAILRRALVGGPVVELAPALNARTRVHEYGGASYLPIRDQVIISNFGENRLHLVRDGEVTPLTPDNSAWRYACGTADPRRGRSIWVREDHTLSAQDAVTTLVAVNLGGGAPRVLVSGHDFYSSPRVSPDGNRLCWLAWNHPNMPWDGTELWLADLDDAGDIVSPRLVAGGPTESIFQPEWSPDGVLHFVTDRSGWWNLHRLEESGSRSLHPAAEEFGLPAWVFSASTYGFVSPDRIAIAHRSTARWHLGLLDPETGILRDLEIPECELRQGVRAGGGRIAYIGGTGHVQRRLVLLDPVSGDREIVAGPQTSALPAELISVARPLEFATSGGRTAHAFLFLPTNPEYEGEEGSLPPLLVNIHGGPTAESTAQLDLAVQYWTSRGFAFATVNYGGSTGYGRDYRRRLDLNWGVVDVEDAEAAAHHLVDQGLVDPGKVAIRGGSAGGYTTLLALTRPGPFRTGTSYFGLADLESFLGETHKFEARYFDSLLGPHPAAAATYRERSPIHHVEDFNSPVLMLQGLDDLIVPPSQSRLMADGLRRRGIPFALVEYPGEGHGFRQAANIVHAAETELHFYSRVFGFHAPAPDPAVVIENAERLVAVTPA